MLRPRKILLVVIAAVVIGTYFLVYPVSKFPSKIRAGYFNFSPYMIVSPDHVPRGFIIDSFEALARRNGFTIEWVNTTGRIEAALASGEIEVYPLLLRTSARLQQFGITEAWWQTTMVLVSRSEAPVLIKSDLSAKYVSVFEGSHTASLVKEHFPGSIQIPTKINDAVLTPLCNGQASAAVADSRSMNLLLARTDRPCPGVSFHIQPFSELTLHYGVATRRANADLGVMIQAAFLDMTMDGTLQSIGARWNVYSTNQIGVFRDLVRFKNQSFWLFCLILLLAAAVAGISRLYYRTRDARRDALDASNTQSRFLTNMSHEIRTPLNGILGMTGLLSATDLNPTQRDYLDTVTHSGEVLLALINDCLDLAKIESGKLQLEAVEVSIERTVESVVQSCAGKAHQKSISIGAFIDPKIPSTVHTDPTRLQQILFNLIGNAVKFTPIGQVWVEANLFAAGTVRFTIDDSGPGIPLEASHHLFERFTQADATTTRKYGGTGLGLAISKELVQLLGGDIGHESIATGGSRFWFTLPIQVSAPVPAPTFKKRIALSTHDSSSILLLNRLLPLWGSSLVGVDQSPDLILEGPDWKPPIRQSRLREALSGQSFAKVKKRHAQNANLGLSVLVAEDNLVNQRLVVAFLERLGCEVQLVENGKLAVEAAQSNKFDVILMDYQMPVLDGLSAARQIRLSGGINSQIPIIAVTAGIMALEPAQIQDAGINQVLAKPYSLEALRIILQAYLPRESQVRND